MPRKSKGYSRVDSESTNTHGWLVRIKRGDVRKSRFISDSTHGGKKKSKAVAEQVYNEWVAELPSPETSEGKISSRNNTGVVGVHFSHDVDDRFPGCEYESYIASWLDDNGKRCKIGFSCNKYGKDAFQLACLAREMRSSDRNKVAAAFAKGGSKATKKVAKTAVGKKATSVKSAKKTVKKAAKKVAKKKTARKK